MPGAQQEPRTPTVWTRPPADRAMLESVSEYMKSGERVRELLLHDYLDAGFTSLEDYVGVPEGWYDAMMPPLVWMGGPVTEIPGDEPPTNAVPDLDEEWRREEALRLWENLRDQGAQQLVRWKSVLGARRNPHVVAKALSIVRKCENIAQGGKKLGDALRKVFADSMRAAGDHPGGPSRPPSQMMKRKISRLIDDVLLCPKKLIDLIDALEPEPGEPASHRKNWEAARQAVLHAGG